MIPHFRYLLWAISIALISCNPSGQNETENTELIDDLGRKLTIKKEVKRVVSLTPSVTELVGLICTPAQLVGRTKHCNYPASINSASVIDVYPLNVEALVKLQPDLVLVKEGFISTAHLDKLQSLGIPVYVQRYTSLNDIFRNARIIGAITSNEDRGNVVADSLTAIKDSLQRTIPKHTHTTLVLIGANPICLYGQGSFCDDILSLSGFKNIAGKELNGEFPSATPEYLLSRNPEVLLGTEGIFEGDQVFKQYEVLKKMRVWEHKQYFIINSDLFSRPGPRIFQSVYQLRALPLND